MIFESSHSRQEPDPESLKPVAADLREFCFGPGVPPSEADPDGGRGSAISYPGAGPRRQTGYVLSDLHIYARRSTFREMLSEIRQAAQSADVLVLNGDIFDFQWSVLASLDETVERATLGLERIVKANPQCRFHYIIGNHDNVAAFHERLDDLARRLPNFEWEPFCLKLGRNVFLHGDICDKSMSAVEFAEYREESSAGKKHGPWAHFFYDLVNSLGVQKFAHWRQYKKPLAKAILKYLEDYDPALLKNVDHIYIGHTHIHFSGYQYRGYTFHNSGAAVRGMKPKMLPLDL